MRVLVDGYWWISGPPSGRMVLREMVTAWRRTYPDDDLHVVVPAADLERARTESSDLTFTGTRLRWHPLINRVALRRLHRQDGPFDATFAQNFAAGVANSGVFVHDVLFQSDPQWFTRTERLYLGLIPFFGRRADVVFTSSRTERERIRDRNPRMRRVEATGLGVPASVVAPPADLDADPGLLPGDFLLTVGRLNVRKNVGTVIAAAIRTGRVSPETPLVIVGSADGRGEGLSGAARAAVDDGSVRFAGAVSDARLAWLYRECRLMLFLSLDEGYGLPPIEALACGAPVIASDRPVMREVLGAAASYADPLDVAAVAAAITNELDARRTPAVEQAPGNRPWAEVVSTIRSAFASGDIRR